MRAIVVGLGVMGKNHARALKKLGLTVTTVDPCVTADRKSLTECGKADYCVIATPPSLLAEEAVTALRKGYAVLVEKPMALNADDAELLAEVAKDTGKMLRVGYTERFNPAVSALRDALPLVGCITRVSIRRLGPKSRSTLSPALDLATHDLDMLRFLGLEPHFLDAVVSDGHLLAQLRLKHGRATIGASHRHPAKIRTLTVMGRKGMLALDYQNQTVVFVGNKATREIPVDRDEPLLNEWRGFFRGQGATAEDGIEALKLAAQIKQTVLA